MSEQAPMVSIGMPVRNGQKYLKHAIDSLLGQTFGDLEVVVADNCSTDATEEICREFMRQIDEGNLEADVVLGRDEVQKLKQLLPRHEWPEAIQ